MKIFMDILALSVAGALAVSGCAGEGKDSQKDTENTAQNSQETQSEDTAKGDGQGSASGGQTGGGQGDNENELAVDYEDTNITEWFYSPESSGETEDKLITIDSVQLGTAGASLKEAAAGAALINLTKAQDVEAVLDEYLSGMSAIQKDFFSFQMEMAYAKAKEIFSDFEGQKPLLSDAGIEDLDINDYSEDELDSLYDMIKDKLKAEGVTDQWKEHTDMEPFFVMAE